MTDHLINDLCSSFQDEVQVTSHNNDKSSREELQDNGYNTKNHLIFCSMLLVLNVLKILQLVL